MLSHLLQLWEHAGQIQQRGALCDRTVPSVPRLESPSQLLGAHPSPGRHPPCVHTTHMQASVPRLKGACTGKKPGKYVSKALKNDVCNALHLCATHVAHIRKAIGPEQGILAGQKSPYMI